MERELLEPQPCERNDGRGLLSLSVAFDKIREDIQRSPSNSLGEKIYIRKLREYISKIDH